MTLLCKFQSHLYIFNRIKCKRCTFYLKAYNCHFKQLLLGNFEDFWRHAGYETVRYIGIKYYLSQFSLLDLKQSNPFYSPHYANTTEIVYDWKLINSSNGKTYSFLGKIELSLGNNTGNLTFKIEKVETFWACEWHFVIHCL